MIDPKTLPSTSCIVCNEPKEGSAMVPGALVRPALAEFITKEFPAWTRSMPICTDCLNRFRTEFVLDALKEETGELSELNAQVARSLRENELMSADPGKLFEGRLTLGERIADRVAMFGGSWRFIILFGGIIVVWTATNTVLALGAFDPYPFILLNLLLSCLAALQAPVIMMSQNRQEAKDRMRGEHDYRVNLKAELEIRQLHDKIDLLLTHQWQKLLEIQAIQMEMIRESRQEGTRGEGG